MIERLLMSRTFRRYIEAWTVVLMPWVLFTEQEGVTMDGMFPLAKEKDDADWHDTIDDMYLTPEEEKEMEDRRAVWNEDDWRKSPTEQKGEVACTIPNCPRCAGREEKLYT